MSQVIADTYEIMDELGSGGGGVVYRARHIRLDKLVALKADKREVTTKPEKLRREVDALKNLSHTYIPQVYDFIIEDGTVYTVIDYIEGESLDKPLKRGEQFSQPQVIEWACQLLEALCYLHSRPPHGILHSDIKPANVMLTPQGDIRLIDFNIALALGAEGAVRVGFSQGYASPEHYGVDYSRSGRTTSQNSESPSVMATVLLDENDVPVSSGSAGSAGSATGSRKRTVLLDVRSDIYSLGATLYHLFTGQRPARDAKQVVPITAAAISPAVADIIRKAMAPDPDDRYQTAQEMLTAFEHLHENDARTKRHKRHIKISAVSLAVLFLAGGICTFTGLKQREQLQAAGRVAAETAENALSAVRSAESTYQAGDRLRAMQFALDALALDSPYAAQAQKALTDALGVYDIFDGYKPYLLPELPSEPLKVVLSPEGTRAAVMVSGQLFLLDTQTGERLLSLPTDPSALSDVIFSGENTIFYAGEKGLEAYDIAQGKTLWSGRPATGIALSSDGTAVAAVYKDEQTAAIYDTATGTVRREIDFQGKSQSVAANDGFVDPNDNIFALNQDGTLLAVSFANGALWAFDTQNSENDIEIYDVSDYTQFEGGFSGQYFAFSSTKDNESVLAVLDMQALEQVAALSDTIPIHVQANQSGIYACQGNTITKLDMTAGQEIEIAHTDADITAFDWDGSHTIVATNDGAFSIYDASANLLEKYEGGNRSDFIQIAGDIAISASWDAPNIRILRAENHADTQIFAYDANYAHDEARLNADGTTIMLFRYDGFRIYGINGGMICEMPIPDAAQVYDQQYRKEQGESYLEVIYNSGLIRKYSALDGSLLSEEQGEKPDDTLYEEFETDKYRITSPLHGTPAVYDKASGELVKELEPDAYLTYVTQLKDGSIMTEYISADASADAVRYGILLDADCNVLARLPDLCDITEDNRLIFDDNHGNLRQSRVYSIDELTALAKERLSGITS